MLVIVLCAFLCARLATLSANGAKPGRELAPARHEPHRENTEVCAIAIEFNAARHYLHVLPAQTFKAQCSHAIMQAIQAWIQLWYF